MWTYLARCPDNFPRGKLLPVRVSVWFRVSVKIRVGGGSQFSSGAIVLEPPSTHELNPWTTINYRVSDTNTVT